MTVNERLFAAGLLDQFDAAAKRRDAQAMQVVLLQVELTEADAAACVNAILEYPERFGF